VTSPDSSFAELLTLVEAVRETLRRGEQAFACECNDPGCRRVIRLTAAEHDAVRAQEGLLLAPGHRLWTAPEAAA
jgi:hypothetical protein